MTEEMVSQISAFKEALSQTPDVHLLAQMVGFMADKLMELDVEALCGAGTHERSENRLNHCNGYRSRSWHTRSGTVEVRIPRLPSVSGKLSALSFFSIF